MSQHPALYTTAIIGAVVVGGILVYRRYMRQTNIPTSDQSQPLVTEQEVSGLAEDLHTLCDDFGIELCRGILQFRGSHKLRYGFDEYRRIYINLPVILERGDNSHYTSFCVYQRYTDNQNVFAMFNNDPKFPSTTLFVDSSGKFDIDTLRMLLTGSILQLSEDTTIRIQPNFIRK